MERAISERLPRVELHLDAAASHADAEVVRLLAAMLGSPYFDLGKRVALSGSPIDGECDPVADPAAHEGIPIAVRSLLLAVSEVDAPAPISAEISLFDDYLDDVGAESVLRAAAAALEPGSPRIVHLHEADTACVKYSLAGLWWWAVRLLLSGPSETYHREYHLASHRFSESKEGLNRLADLRLFLPTAHGRNARTEVVADPTVLAVPQSLLPALGRMLPEAQPYLLPVTTGSMQGAAVLVNRGLPRGTVIELDAGELRAIRRSWTARGRRRFVAGMRVRGAVNQFIASLYSNQTAVRVLRVPSQRFSRLSGAVRALLTTSGSQTLQNPYLSRDERELLGDPAGHDS